MKRLFTTICLAVLGIATFSSCQKEAQVVNDKPLAGEAIMRVDADAVSTRTYISEVDATHYNLGWSEGDEIACFEVSMVESTPTIQGKVISTPLASAVASASFTMDFSANSGSGDFSYIFVYPASKYSKSTGVTPIYRALIEKDQTFSSTSFDKNADLLISRAITGQDTRPTSVKAQFERIGATALMNIKAPTTTETIRKITFSTTEGNIQGYYKVYPLDGTHETALYSGGKSIELIPASTTIYTGTIPVWFRLAEITLDDDFTVVVETNKKTYTKVVNLASAGRSIAFTNSGLTKFNVNMEAVTGEANTSLDNGDYYIVAKSGENYYALSSVASGDRLAYEQLTDFNPSASTYLGINDNLIWTITNDADAITIEQGSGTYLTPKSKGASTGATKKTYTLANGSADGTLILNSEDLSGYGLRFNVGNYFAFYNSEPSVSMIANMYFMPKDPRPRVAAPSNVDADVTGKTISVIWDDAVDANIDHYHVTLYLSDAESDSADIDPGDEACEFTGLADGVYSVSVQAVPISSVTHYNSIPVVVSNLVIGAAPLTYTYTFTSTAWAATIGGNPANWHSDKNGSATGDSRGISIQKAATGAGATSTDSYESVSNVSITLSRSGGGSGSVDIYVGSTKIGTQSTFTTTATSYSFDVDPALDGKVSFVVTCSASTIYVKDISITATGISAGSGDSVTFTPGTDTDDTTVTKSGITVTMSTMNNASYYQVYASSTMTVTSTTHTITGISFDCTASGTSKYGPGNASADVGTYSYAGSTGTWTGSASSVSISSTAQIRMTTLTITYE